MNIKSLMLASTILISAAAMAPLQAQNGGLFIGQPQPQNPLATPGSANPVQGMTTSPIQPMASSPILPLGGGIGTQSQQIATVPLQSIGLAGNSQINVLPPGGVIFVPAGTLVIENSPGREPGAFLSAPVAASGQSSPSGRGGTSNQRTGRSPANESQNDPKQDVTRLELGTPRDKVVDKYGNPIAFVQSMNGETLYFKGGVVVFIKNGVVASPGN